MEINGGYVTITMGQGDTDGIDSNGNIYINGGTIFVNGEETDKITNQFENGGMGGFGGRNRGFGRDRRQDGDSGEMPDGMEPPEGFEKGEMPEDFDPGQRPDKGKRNREGQTE